MRPIDELAAEICTLAGNINAANHRFLVMIAEYDRRDGWAAGGATQSCAHWLNWKCGIALGAAREPLNVGRKTRTISATLRRVLKARDQGCRFPGCSNTRYIDAHHVEHWANGGETKPSNLVSLCRFHHHAVHEGGIRIDILDDGALRFVKPNGSSVDSVAPGFTQPLGDWKQLPAGTLVNRWRGERMDHGLAVEVLMQQARRAKNVPAGTR
jgi:HNH endonuclease